MLVAMKKGGILIFSLWHYLSCFYSHMIFPTTASQGKQPFMFLYV